MNIAADVNGREGGIRTHGPNERPTVFKTVAINQTPPPLHYIWRLYRDLNPIFRIDSPAC